MRTAHSSCPNCGYTFHVEASEPLRVYTACPRCGQHLDPPVSVGRSDEGTAPQKSYDPIVE